MGSASYTKGAKRVGGNHEWVWYEPRMDTNGKFRTTNGHEWRERKIQNHEWTRMDTNGHEWTRMGWREPRNTRKARKENSEPRMDTNGHEWNHEIQEWNHETHEKHEKRQGG